MNEKIATKNLIKLTKSGELDAQHVLEVVLNYMGEQGVQDMAYATSIFATEEDWDIDED